MILALGMSAFGQSATPAPSLSKQEGAKWIATASVPKGPPACFINVSSDKPVATSDYLQP